MDQNYKNHAQIVYGYYLTTGIPILVLIGISTFTAYHYEGALRHWSYLFLLVGWILLSLMFRSRGFGLKAQDRAIRAEENLRHYVLTGKLMDKRLSVHQIVALRFASDEELELLAQRAVNEDLSPKAIKQAIINWRADTYRV